MQLPLVQLNVQIDTLYIDQNNPVASDTHTAKHYVIMLKY